MNIISYSKVTIIMKLSKNILLVICFCILCCFSTIKICFAERACINKWDVNNDDKINIADIIYGLQILSDQTKNNDFLLYNARLHEGSSYYGELSPETMIRFLSSNEVERIQEKLLPYLENLSSHGWYPGIPDRTIVLPDGERIVYGGSMGDEVAVNGGFFRSETFVHFLLTNENNFNPCDREDDYESGFNDGRQSCIDNPVSCGINVK